MHVVHAERTHFSVICNKAFCLHIVCGVAYARAITFIYTANDRDINDLQVTYTLFEVTEKYSPYNLNPEHPCKS